MAECCRADFDHLARARLAGGNYACLVPRRAHNSSHLRDRSFPSSLILLVIASLLFYVLVRPSEQIAARPVLTPAEAVTFIRAAPAAKPAGISVANSLRCLRSVRRPGRIFLRWYDGGDHLRAGKNPPKLPVVGRTSAFAFKGKNEDMSAIGRTLHATYLLEGSVRKDAMRFVLRHSSLSAEDGRPSCGLMNYDTASWWHLHDPGRCR